MLIRAALGVVTAAGIARAGSPCCADAGRIVDDRLISSLSGGFGGALDDNDQLGRAVTNIGDLDGDGVSDLALGAMLDDDGGTDRGCAWVLFMNADGTVRAEQKISSTAGGFTGALDNGDRFGMSIAALGDVDADGVEDIAVGARGDDDGGTNRGAIWVLFLNADGTVRAHQKISDLVGGFMDALHTGDGFGSSAAGIGDLDGDGRSELAVGAILFDDGGLDRGAIWVLFLNADGTVRAEQRISDVAGQFAGELRNGDQFGTSIAPVGDIDADGVVDIAVGAPFDDDGGPDRGALWLLKMNTAGTVRAHEKISDAAGAFAGGLADGDQLGSSVARMGVVERNGYQRFLVGAPGSDDGGMNRGAVWAVFREVNGTMRGAMEISSSSGWKGAGLSDGDGFGVGMASMGDLDGDGFLDTVVGVHLDDDGGTDRGGAWLLSLGGCADVPAECCEGDVDGIDGVNFADVTEWLTFYGNIGAVGTMVGGDGNCDCVVDFRDVTAVLTSFGLGCPAEEARER